ncbi:MAG TPA: KilA-N domain-containing protein [Gemmataceae bacterium]
MSSLVPSPISHIYNDVVILQRGDGYWNATAMCQANGKRWHNYYRNQETQEFLEALAAEMRIPVARIRATGKVLDDIGLVDIIHGGPPILQGTWVHRRVALDLARWCSAQFAVKVNAWVEELLTKGRVELAPSTLVRAWTERIMPAFEAHKRHIVMNCPDGAWSILTASVGETLLTEDELLRHCLPIEHHNLPDGSMGNMYSKYREGKPWVKARLYAPLVLPSWCKADGSDVEVQVAVYDADERKYFERWLSKSYFPEHLYGYLERKFSHKKYGLTSASAADNASRRVTGRRAALPSQVLRQIDQAGGFIPTQHLLGRKGEQGQLFDNLEE